ncbi:MAG: peptidoglycan DD-metalloendopeptidase family protein, partial [Bdellovibrio sp.]
MKTKMALLTLALAAPLSFYLVQQHLMKDDRTPASSEPEIVAEIPQPPVEERYPFVMPAKSTLSAELSKLQFSSQDIHDLVQAAKPLKDLGRIAPGTRFQIHRSPHDEGAVESIRFRFSPVDILLLSRTATGWSAEKVIKPITTQIITYRGNVQNSLWESAVEAKMNPGLIADLTEVFAWQVDFARQVQVNDRWRISVEQELVNGEPVGLGTILSAEYVNVDQVYTAILFRKDGKNLGYFAPDGSSLKRMFLKSPIQYSRISSRFQRNRFHPVLKTARPHLGVDYAAPIGTPIRAVGDGVIEFAGWSGGGGNVIKLRHNSTYDTAYKHLSCFAPGIKRG